MNATPLSPPPPSTTDQRVDAALSTLLVVQALTLFVAIPLGAAHPAFRILLDAGHLIFAGVCVTVLTRHPLVQGALLAALALLAVGPIAGATASARLGLDADVLHETIACAAFAFNAMLTALVARHVFAPGRVTVHRVRGAILLYLNVAALFAIAYGVVETHAPGAIVATGSAVLAAPGARNAALTYFSLSTLTTSGFGDFVPVHPLARSMANFEGVFGQLFPATLLARLVALQLAHGRDAP
jgi:hypothetical protein